MLGGREVLISGEGRLLLLGVGLRACILQACVTAAASGDATDESKSASKQSGQQLSVHVQKTAATGTRIRCIRVDIHASP